MESYITTGEERETMKVGELIAVLSKFAPRRKVAISVMGKSTDRDCVVRVSGSLGSTEFDTATKTVYLVAEDCDVEIWEDSDETKYDSVSSGEDREPA